MYCNWPGLTPPLRTPTNQARLGIAIGDCDAIGAAILVDATADNHCVYGVAIGQGIIQALKRHHTHAFRAHIAVCCGVVGAGEPFGDKKPPLIQ